jgi:hypothetical protein
MGLSVSVSETGEKSYTPLKFWERRGLGSFRKRRRRNYDVMTRRDYIKAISKRVHLPAPMIEVVLDTFSDIAKERLLEGKAATIPGVADISMLTFTRRCYDITRGRFLKVENSFKGHCRVIGQCRKEFQARRIISGWPEADAAHAAKKRDSLADSLASTPSPDPSPGLPATTADAIGPRGAGSATSSLASDS